MKTFTFCLMILLSGSLVLYIGFIALVSVWVGLGHIHHQGSWVPILAGTLSLFIVFFLFLKILKGLLVMKRRDDLLM